MNTNNTEQPDLMAEVRAIAARQHWEVLAHIQAQAPSVRPETFKNLQAIYDERDRIIHAQGCRIRDLISENESLRKALDDSEAQKSINRLTRERKELEAQADQAIALLNHYAEHYSEYSPERIRHALVEIAEEVL